MIRVLLSDFDEGVASHVLDSFVSLVSKLKELVDHGLEELPVSLEETRVLSDNVHDVGCDDRLISIKPRRSGYSEELHVSLSRYEPTSSRRAYL